MQRDHIRNLDRRQRRASHRLMIFQRRLLNNISPYIYRATPVFETIRSIPSAIRLASSSFVVLFFGQKKERERKRKSQMRRFSACTTTYIHASRPCSTWADEISGTDPHNETIDCGCSRGIYHILSSTLLRLEDYYSCYEKRRELISRVAVASIFSSRTRYFKCCLVISALH